MIANVSKDYYGNNKISSFLIAFCLFMTQFYFWDSGLPQISHILALIGLVCYCVTNRYIKVKNTQLLSFFVAYVVLNNLIWFFINDFNESYLWSITYWLFNYALFILIKNLNKNPFFIKFILIAVFISYILELVIWGLGIGSYKFYPRYNGLFNDPNQMAFWVLCTSAIFIKLSKNKFFDVFIYSISLFLILITLSRSALLGIPFLTLALISKNEGGIQKKIILTFLSFSVASIVLITLNNYGYFDDIFKRLIEGITEKDKQGDDRGFNVIYDFPEHLIFGAGQGRYDLYTAVGGEIHSTWIGILFYYGVFGFSFFIAFIFQGFKDLTLTDKILFLSTVLYGFTTYSARNTIFWFLLGIFMFSKPIELKKRN